MEDNMQAVLDGLHRSGVIVRVSDLKYIMITVTTNDKPVAKATFTKEDALLLAEMLKSASRQAK
jgi:hypothetical protein